jgi:DNA-3-methyladenine glycosylase
VEAYIGREDLASHARFGETNRNRVMFERPGVAYVYLVYGMHACLNVVTEPEGSPAALLVRAVEPLTGVELMRDDRIARATANRRMTTAERSARDALRIRRMPVARLASGPGLVAAAYGLDTSWTGTDLCAAESVLRLEEDLDAGAVAATIVTSARIGIGYAGEPWTSQPWRLSLAGHPSVSGPPRLR